MRVCLPGCIRLWFSGTVVPQREDVSFMTASTQRNAWLEERIRSLILDAPGNRLPDFDDQPVFDAPLVGVARGDDPLFEEFIEIVSDRHFLPCRLLEESAGRRIDPAAVRVVSWANPFTAAIRQSNRGELPSRLYSLARNNGAALIHRAQAQLRGLIEAEGFAAVVPSALAQYDTFRSPRDTFSSTWSERHVAFAAGLGQFGLNAALITPVGINVRFGSIVTELPLEPTPRIYEDYRAPCLRSGGRECGQCVAKCPAGAITSQGLDKEKCYEMRQFIRKKFLDVYPRELQMIELDVVKSGRRKSSYSLGCALCQCGVPCERSMPVLGSAGDADA